MSNIGSWMQTVAAQWLMLTLTGSATYVALVQTAAGLPVVLFAIVAGTIGDLVDRRRFLLVTETFMLVAAAALGALAIAGLVTPWVLLALVFAVGTGQALTSPTWQTLQPELVSPAERTQAISLGSVNQNLARAGRQRRRRRGHGRGRRARRPDAHPDHRGRRAGARPAGRAAPGGSGRSRPRTCCPPATGPRRTWPRTRRPTARCWSASSTGRSPDSKIS